MGMRRMRCAERRQMYMVGRRSAGPPEFRIGAVVVLALAGRMLPALLLVT